jgi:hypothetical protein
MLIYIVVLIAVAAVIETLSLKNPLDFVRYGTYSSKPSVDPGESFEIVSVIENTRRLPLSFVEIQQILPLEISIDLKIAGKHYTESGPGGSWSPTLRLRSTAYLLPRQRLERRIPASLPARGIYHLRGASLHSGDFLGLRRTSRRFDRTSEIVVLPAPAEEAPELAALGGFLGDISVRRFIMEDPVLTLGFRDYTGREPQKAISWVLTARFGKLMVKKYDHTLEPTVTVLLNVECPGNEPDTESVERCFSLARTVCEAFEERRIKYGFITNAFAVGAVGGWSAVADGLGKSHLSAILEGLGRATYDCTEPFEKTAERAARIAENGRSHVIITPFEYKGLAACVRRLKHLTGGETVVIPACSVKKERE